jgi:membrane-associated protease RseP (regulator of RpoE activity)
MGPNRHDGHGPRALRQPGTWVLIAVIVAALLFVGREHLAFILGVVIFVVALLASVMLHELGHFLTAKKFGMKVTQFFVGFGQTLWSTFRGETEYGVKALPFGGFVKITGMTSVEEVDVADEPRSFRNQPGWQRIIVLAAGSFMHFALALFLFFVLAIGIGRSANSNVISSIASCVPASATTLNSANPCTGGNLAKSPAAVAGLKPDDKIVSVAGKPVGSWNKLHTVLKAEKAGVSVPVVVDRGGRQMDFNVTLAAIPGRAVAYLGVEPTVVYQRSGFFGAVSYAGDQFGNTLTSSASAVSHPAPVFPGPGPYRGRAGQQCGRRRRSDRPGSPGRPALAGEGLGAAVPDRLAQHFRRGVQPAAAAAARWRPSGGGDLRTNQGVVQSGARPA